MMVIKAVVNVVNSGRSKPVGGYLRVHSCVLFWPRESVIVLPHNAVVPRTVGYFGGFQSIMSMSSGLASPCLVVDSTTKHVSVDCVGLVLSSMY